MTDDTQLTLATCESIVKKKFIDPAHIAETMTTWFRKGKIRGVGAGTLKALNELSVGGHWALVGRKGKYAAGNGAAIRIAPLAFFTDPDSDEDRQLIRDVARITHHNEEAYVGALAIILGIQSAIRSQFRLTDIADRLPDSRVRDRIQELANLNPDVALSWISKKFGNSGYVVDSAPLALLAAQGILNANSV